MVDVAEIKLWGELVGAVQWDDLRKTASFQYSPAFIKKGIDLSPIKMSITEGDRIFSFPKLRKGKKQEYVNNKTNKNTSECYKKV